MLSLCDLAFDGFDAAALGEAGCAVLYGYETYPSYYLEISAPLLSFWEQALAGQDCAIELVRLKDTHTLSYQKLSVERGKPYAQFLRCEQNVDGTVTASNFERFAVQDWQMTDTGNFYYRLFPPETSITQTTSSFAPCRQIPRASPCWSSMCFRSTTIM
ncbi:MAG: DUF6070 family protein [Oscillospiraceae bacterium]